MVIVGMGPAGLMAGFQVAKQGHEVHFFDHKKAAGRKFLVAGHGGFNLTNAQQLDAFVMEYTHESVREFVRLFTPSDLRFWLEELGIPTYVGTSGRVFPQKGIKPIEVLNQILEALKLLGCHFHYQHSLLDFFEQSVLFLKSDLSEFRMDFDFLVLALGGASWPQTGSTAAWVSLFEKKYIQVNSFKSANSGFVIKENFPLLTQGKPIKNALFSLGKSSRLGEAVITDYGIEGSAIYYLNRTYHLENETQLFIDFKPNLTWESFLEFVQKAKNRKDLFQKMKVSEVAQLMLKERLTKEVYLNDRFLFQLIKAFPLTISGLRPIQEVISSCGGVSWKSVNNKGRLISFSSVFVAGEMLDWDAPTGGYLLQACFSNGFVVGQEINQLLVNSR